MFTFSPASEPVTVSLHLAEGTPLEETQRRWGLVQSEHQDFVALATEAIHEAHQQMRTLQSELAAARRALDAKEDEVLGKVADLQALQALYSGEIHEVGSMVEWMRLQDRQQQEVLEAEVEDRIALMTAEVEGRFELLDQLQGQGQVLCQTVSNLGSAHDVVGKGDWVGMGLWALSEGVAHGRASPACAKRALMLPQK